MMFSVLSVLVCCVFAARVEIDTDTEKGWQKIDRFKIPTIFDMAEACISYIQSSTSRDKVRFDRELPLTLTFTDSANVKWRVTLETLDDVINISFPGATAVTFYESGEGVDSNGNKVISPAGGHKTMWFNPQTNFITATFRFKERVLPQYNVARGFLDVLTVGISAGARAAFCINCSPAIDIEVVGYTLDGIGELLVTTRKWNNVMDQVVKGSEAVKNVGEGVGAIMEGAAAVASAAGGRRRRFLEGGIELGSIRTFAQGCEFNPDALRALSRPELVRKLNNPEPAAQEFVQVSPGKFVPVQQPQYVEVSPGRYVQNPQYVGEHATGPQQGAYAPAPQKCLWVAFYATEICECVQPNDPCFKRLSCTEIDRELCNLLR